MSSKPRDKTKIENSVLDRRKILLGSTTLAAASALGAGTPVKVAQAQGQQPAAPSVRSIRASSDVSQELMVLSSPSRRTESRHGS